MYTLFFIFGVVTLIAVITGIIIYGFVSAFQWIENDNSSWAKSFKIWTTLILVFILSVVILFGASKGLAEAECKENNGTFESWDNGFAWECYNPYLINQENNFRILNDSGDK